MSSLADILKDKGIDTGDEFSSNTDEYNRLIDSINKGTGSFEQIYNFTDRTGQAASNYLNKQCEALLVNNQVPKEVAESIVKPVLEATSQMSSETANELCSKINHQAGVNVKIQNLPVDKSTANGMANKLISGPYDQTNWIIGDGPVSNLAMHSVDQTIQANADFISKSGKRAKIRRRSEANCCDWCENLAGEWDYGEEPKDVYRRHNNCRCVVEYIVDGKAQNVWNKKDTHPDQYVHSVSTAPIKNTAILDAIKSGAVKDEINDNKQLPHCSETRDKSSTRSYIYGDLQRAKQLYNQYRGTGKPVSDSKGNIQIKERITCDEVIGVYFDIKTGQFMETKGLMIIYSKTGSHLFPRKEKVNG